MTEATPRGYTTAQKRSLRLLKEGSAAVLERREALKGMTHEELLEVLLRGRS